MIYHLICGSYFDPLGHPIFANKIAENIAIDGKGEDSVCIYGIHLGPEAASLESNIISVNIPVIGRFYCIEARRNLKKRLGVLGVLLSFVIRLFVVTLFYIMVYRRIGINDAFVDLEYEPFQELIAAKITNINTKNIGVIHSFPDIGSYSLKGLYKKVSIWIYKASLRRNPQKKIALMNDKAFNNALMRGFDGDRLSLAGWGYDLRPKTRSSPRPQSSSMRVKVLSFGVMRLDKRIEKLVEIFLALDDANIELNIVGRSLDVDVKNLVTSIEVSQSKTIVTVVDQFVDNDDIDTLIQAHDIMVLSHSSSFESMSGPMLLAIENNKPILCFSKNSVADLVEATRSGVLVDMDSVVSDDLANRITELANLKYDSGILEQFQWRSIAKRLANGLE